VGTNALQLNGSSNTNGAYINVPASLNTMGATTAITIASWVNITTDRAWGRIFDFNNTSTTGYMFLTTYQNMTTPNSVRFAITMTDNTAEQQISSTARLSTGAWHHIVVVLGAGATYTGTLYIDGASAGTNTAMTLRPSSIGNTANNFIGRSAFTPDPYFAGLIDDFRVYNRALTAAEVTMLYAVR
jgi:Concanavalin A-like lectin/glucanases superfamily